MTPFSITFVLLFGLVIGSFLTVLIYRIPACRDDLDEDPFPEQDSKPGEDRGDEGLDDPVSNEADIVARPRKHVQGINAPKRSLCPACGAQLKWYHNIPVVSWVIQRGRCAFCQTGIPFRYPMVEILTALAAYLSAQTFGLNPTGALVFIFCAVLIVISFIDYDYYIIPNVITLPGLVIGVGIAALNQFTGIFDAPPISSGLMDAFWGVLVGGGFLWLFAEVYYLLRKKDGLGMGDVKLLAMTGAVFGPAGAIYTIFFGSVFGSVLGVLMILLAGRKWGKPLPFGPYLAIGTVVYLFAGEEIMRWWFQHTVAGLM